MSCFLKPTDWEAAEGSGGQWGRTEGPRERKEMELSSGARKITPRGSGREDRMRERRDGSTER